jgi:hypothetical protein
LYIVNILKKVMAKEKENEEEKQVPEKPKRKVSAGTGDLSLIQFIGIIAGVLIVMVVIIVLAIKFLILPELKPSEEHGTVDSSKKTEEVSKSDDKEKRAEEEKKKRASSGTKSYDIEKALFSQTGRITTNAKNSDQFVVLDLGIMFTPEGEGESGGGHGGPAKDPLPDKLKSMIKGSVNNVIGSMTVDEIQQKRDSLSFIFYDKLRKIFYTNKMVLNEIVIQEFIIQ